MALLKMFGNAKKNDTGEWFDLGQDPDHPELTVKFRIRRVPDPEERKMVQNYGSEEKVQVQIADRSAWMRQRILSVEDMQMFAVDKACYALIDCEHFVVRAEDDEQVKFLTQYLPESKVASKGAEISLDGLLTPDLKRYIFTQYPELAEWVNEKAGTISKNKAKAEDKLSKN